MHLPATAAEEAVAAELAGLSETGPAGTRPDGLGSAYAAALPGARGAVLTRLWRAFAYEPLPWITHRERGSGSLALRLASGSRLEGPLPDPYATTFCAARASAPP